MYAGGGRGEKWMCNGQQVQKVFVRGQGRHSRAVSCVLNFVCVWLGGGGTYTATERSWCKESSIQAFESLVAQLEAKWSAIAGEPIWVQPQHTAEVNRYDEETTASRTTP